LSKVNKNSFKFWVPCDVIKSKDKDGKEEMIMQGVASTGDKDSQEQYLNPKGFNLDYFKRAGTINWHHQTKEQPKTIIGEPLEANINKDNDLYVKFYLYPNSKVAREVYELAEVLKKDSKSGRRLGLSIEGQATEKDPINENIILGANITGLAVTHQPINAQTWTDIVKGNVDWDYEPEFEIVETNKGNGGKIKFIAVQKLANGKTLKVDSEGKFHIIEKCLDTTSGRSLIPSNLNAKDKKEKKNYFSKGEVFKQLLGDTNDIEKANKIYTLINKIQVMENNILGLTDLTKISEDAIQKAMDLLNGTSDINELLEKAKRGKEEENGSKPEKEIEKKKTEDEDDDDDDGEKEYNVNEMNKAQLIDLMGMIEKGGIAKFDHGEKKREDLEEEDLRKCILAKSKDGLFYKGMQDETGEDKKPETVILKENDHAGQGGSKDDPSNKIFKSIENDIEKAIKDNTEPIIDVFKGILTNINKTTETKFAETGNLLKEVIENLNKSIESQNILQKAFNDYLNTPSGQKSIKNANLEKTNIGSERFITENNIQYAKYNVRDSEEKSKLANLLARINDVEIAKGNNNNIYGIAELRILENGTIPAEILKQIADDQKIIICAE
jgi:hypothetical protein